MFPANNLQNLLESFVGAVAQNRVSRVLASTKIDGFGFGSFKLRGREFASLMASIAKRLVGALAACTPKVTFAGFDSNRIRAFLGNDWV
jgi:hypothetical protein